MFFTNVIFWPKKSKFSSKMAFEGVPFTKIMSPPELKGRKKSSAGRTLAMSALDHGFCLH